MKTIDLEDIKHSVLFGLGDQELWSALQNAYYTISDHDYFSRLWLTTIPTDRAITWATTLHTLGCKVWLSNYTPTTITLEIYEDTSDSLTTEQNTVMLQDLLEDFITNYDNS